jgi:hypothetical protein
VYAGNVDGLTLCRMYNDATSGHCCPTYLSSDNDPLFQYHRWKANLRVLDIEEIKSLPHAPMSHPFVERLIGSIRRELLDRTLFWTATDLENKLLELGIRQGQAIHPLEPVWAQASYRSNVSSCENFSAKPSGNLNSLCIDWQIAC